MARAGFVCYVNTVRFALSVFLLIAPVGVSARVLCAFICAGLINGFCPLCFRCVGVREGCVRSGGFSVLIFSKLYACVSFYDS